jgi:hypothetical protein
MAAGGGDQLALFNQYDNEYCAKATDVARKIEAVTSLSGGKPQELAQCAREGESVILGIWPVLCKTPGLSTVLQGFTRHPFAPFFQGSINVQRYCVKRVVAAFLSIEERRF